MVLTNTTRITNVRASGLAILMTLATGLAAPLYAQGAPGREGAAGALPMGGSGDAGSIRTEREIRQQNREGGRVVSTDYITVEYQVSWELRRLQDVKGPKPDFECKNECKAAGNHEHDQCTDACSKEAPAANHTKRFKGTYTPTIREMRKAEHWANYLAAENGAHPSDVDWSSRTSQLLVQLKQWAEEPVDVTMAHAGRCSWKNGTQVFGDYTVTITGTFTRHIRRVSGGVSVNLPPEFGGFHSNNVARLTKPEFIETMSGVNCACRKVPVAVADNPIGVTGHDFDHQHRDLMAHMTPAVQSGQGNSLFQQMILEGADFGGARDTVVQRAAPSLRELFRNAVETLIGTPVSADANGFLSIIATGLSSGDAFQIRKADGAGNGPVRLPNGLVLQAVKSALPASGAGNLVGSALGYCLEFAKASPSAGVLYKIATLEQQKKFAPMRSVLQAALKLANNGQLHPDSDPKDYAGAIKQWALWTKAEGWNQAAFTEKLIEHTRKNVLNAKMAWTKDVEKAVRAAAAGRWQDVGQVLAAANKLSAGS